MHTTARGDLHLSEETQAVRFSKAVCMREYRGKNPEGRASFYVTVPRDIASFMGLKRGELLELIVRRVAKQT